MVRSTFALKAIAFLIAVASFGQASSASDVLTQENKEALRKVDMTSYEIDEHGNARELWGGGNGFNWNILLFNLGWCGCDKGPLGGECPMCYGPLKPPKECNCACKDAEDFDACVASGGYETESGEWVDAGGAATSDGSSGSNGAVSSGGENRSTTSGSRKSMWWPYALGAAVVGLVGAAIVMRKRRNAALAEEDLNGDASLSGAVNKRAALLSGGAAAGAAGSAPPQFLNVPSFRKTASGLEVGPDGAILEQPPSNYMEMDNHVDSSQLPPGIEISESGNLEPYHGGSMA